jgi:Tfp pilus assembly protein PilO
MITGKKIFGAFALAIAMFFFWPAVIGSWQEMKALRSALAERQDLNSQRTTILENAQKSYAQYQSIISGQSGRMFTELVPVKKNTAELVSAFQDMAYSSGIQLNEVRMGAATGTGGDQYKTLTLTLDMSGSYISLRTFLGSLEQYVRVLNVKSIEVSTAQQTSALKFSIIAETYFIE